MKKTACESDGPRFHGTLSYVLSVFVWISIAGIAAVSLIIEYFLGWLLFFSPGWANRRPFGLSYESAVATGVAAHSSLMLMTAAASAGAIVASICALFRIGGRRRLELYVWWLLFAGIVVLCAIPFIFAWSHARA